MQFRQPSTRTGHGQEPRTGHALNLGDVGRLEGLQCIAFITNSPDFMPGLVLPVYLAWFLLCVKVIGRVGEGRSPMVGSLLFFFSVFRNAGESFNDRQRKVINRLLDGFEGKLTSSKWAKLAKCSQDTAHRDIVDLVKRGILAKDAGGGRSTGYSLTEPAGKTGPGL